MVTYPGLPAPRITTFLTREASRASYAEGTEFQIDSIDLVANTGTYLDTPAHRFADGFDLSGLPLESVADLAGVKVSLPVTGRKAILPTDLEHIPVENRAVLLHTGWSRHWGTDAYFTDHPHLSGDAADLLVERGARLVGIDSLNIDGTADGYRPAHTSLLRAGIPVVEHLTGLELLPEEGFTFWAVPVKVAGLGTFPVRAVARIGTG